MAPCCRGSLVYVDAKYGVDFVCSPEPCNYGCQPFSVSFAPTSLLQDIDMAWSHRLARVKDGTHILL